MKKKIQHKKNSPGKVYEGNVVDKIDDKTIKVGLKVDKRHPLYKKLIRRSKNLLVHTEMKVEVGDRVKVGEIRKVSKRKNFIVLEVLNK